MSLAELQTRSFFNPSPLLQKYRARRVDNSFIGAPACRKKIGRCTFYFLVGLAPSGVIHITCAINQSKASHFPSSSPNKSTNPSAIAIIMSNSSSKLHLVLLVPELLTAIVSYLLNPDLKSLRLTCKALGEEVPLHFDRVFLSANSRNIEVARAIADNERFRKGVQEIIWDDALLVREIVRPNEAIHMLADSPRAEGDPPTWFIRACKDNIENLKHLKRDRRRLKTREFLSFSESWSYYETLLEQQEEVLESGAILMY